MNNVDNFYLGSSVKFSWELLFDLISFIGSHLFPDKPTVTSHGGYIALHQPIRISILGHFCCLLWSSREDLHLEVVPCADSITGLQMVSRCVLILWYTSRFKAASVIPVHCWACIGCAFPFILLWRYPHLLSWATRHICQDPCVWPPLSLDQSYVVSLVCVVFSFSTWLIVIQ